jgi:hypothetical protein
VFSVAAGLPANVSNPQERNSMIGHLDHLVLTATDADAIHWRCGWSACRCRRLSGFLAGAAELLDLHIGDGVVGRAVTLVQPREVASATADLITALKARPEKVRSYEDCLRT